MQFLLTHSQAPYRCEPVATSIAADTTESTESTADDMSRESDPHFHINKLLRRRTFFPASDSTLQQPGEDVFNPGWRPMLAANRHVYTS